MLYPVPPVNGFNKEDMAYWEGFLTEAEINLLLANKSKGGFWMGMAIASAFSGLVAWFVATWTK